MTRQEPLRRLGPFMAWRVIERHETAWRVSCNVWRLGATVSVKRYAFFYGDRWAVQTNLHYDRKWESE